MRISGDYHTHTYYSHGKGSIEDNVKVGIKKGLKTIAIAEHGPGHVFYGVSYEKLLEIKEEIYRLREKYPEIEILFGIEANFISFDGHIDIKDSFIHEFDFLAVGFHFGILPDNVADFLHFYPNRVISKVSRQYQESICKKATEAMINVTHNYDVKFITHPGAKFGVDIVKLTEEMNPSTMLEINRKHGSLTVEDLKKIENPEIKFILGSDAHSPEDVGDVDRCIEIVKDSGIDTTRVYNIEVTK